jgi:hypothetical protein
VWIAYDMKNRSSATSGIPWPAVIRLLILIFLMLVILFLSAGTVHWWEGWAYTGMTLFVLVFSRAYILIKYPDMARERAQASQKEDVKAWDKIIVPLVAIYGPLVSWIIA